MGNKPNVLITGAGGLVGGKVLKTMAQSRDRFGTIIALDIREIDHNKRIADIEYIVGDI